MGRPPAYVFVVRHGNRLDAADKQWHLTSPTPYDPPLTYGGWLHSRTVGARIAAILQQDGIDAATTAVEASSGLESTSSQSHSPSPTPSSSSTGRRRSFRIVIHSSPFLRCVQTSVAISAGLASNPISSPPNKVKHADPAEPSRSQPAASQSAQASHLNSTPLSPSASPHNSAYNSATHIEKPVLRLDAFLGEWLSPEYFEHITPPPKSALMLATAKAELLRRSSYHDYPHFHARAHLGTSSQLWNNGSSHSSADGPLQVHDSNSASALDTLPQLADSLPVYEADSRESAVLKDAPRASQENNRAPGYVYPVPAYALSTSEPIPRGYVAHARDACVSLDYQWDSSRDRPPWGDGGLLPEEWASMHQRFRRGLRQLIHWYSSTENPSKMVTRTARAPHSYGSDNPLNDGEDDEVENVVILVSHGAGCNALIGALTHQPVLTDVAASSLTMAKRRGDFDYQSTNIAREISASSLDAALPQSKANISDIYELGLCANTDHLVTPSPSTFPRKASLASIDSNARFDAGYASALKELSPGLPYASPSSGSRGNSVNTSLGSMRRPRGGPSLVIQPSVFNSNTGGITVGSGVSSFSTTRPDRSGSGTWGLWSPKPRDDEHGKEPEPLMFLDFSHEKLTADKEVEETQSRDNGSAPLVHTGNSGSTAAVTSEAKRTFRAHSQGAASGNAYNEEERDKFGEDAVPPLRVGTSSGGLWGAPRPPGEAERIRDFSASKRRWTVTER
ncbi:hypothetical protein F4861DRAFT_421243 [Xylaria intraflava]|nr:hypothetical protein F4861DRAFT_421243 [Xylaria intraflava]